MNESSNNLYSSATPEQKLNILRSEMATPIEIIRGCIAVIKKYNESNNNESEDLTECIDAIADAASYLKKLRDELI